MFNISFGKGTAITNLYCLLKRRKFFMVEIIYTKKQGEPGDIRKETEKNENNFF